MAKFYHACSENFTRKSLKEKQVNIKQFNTISDNYYC